MTEYCPACGNEIDDEFKYYRCPVCKALLGALTEKALQEAIKKHICKVKK